MQFTQKWLDIKTTFLTHYLSNLNPKAKGSSFKIDRYIGNYYQKLKWACTVVFWGSIIGLEISAQNRSFVSSSKTGKIDEL